MDIVARPYSRPVGSPFETNCGVRSVSHNILKQDPYNDSSYTPLPEGIYGVRTLVSFDGLIPYGPSPYYNALFFDPSYLFQHPLVWVFRNSYIITNCGKDSIGSNGFNNIWTGPLSHDWNASPPKLNQGGWDTRLRSPFLGGGARHDTAYVNEHAAFPDGRYAVEVTAVSQGDSVSSSRILPSSDVWNSAAPTQGIVVDNYRPHVDSIIVYEIDGAYKSIRYRGGWTTEFKMTNRYPDRIFQPPSWRYLPETTGLLGVAVKYSEPIDEFFPGDIWITAGNHEEIVWHSIENYPGEDYRFYPTSWNEYLGPLPPDSAGQFWQCYESTVPSPGRYAGELTVIIGDYPSLYYPGPRDLAHNELDADPSTISYPRLGSGAFPEDGFESGNDSSYTWGIPEYWYSNFQSSLVRGSRSNGGSSVEGTAVELDTVFSLPYDAVAQTTGPNYGRNSRRAWCPYWAGFWVERENGFSRTDTVWVVKPTLIGDNITWDAVPFDYPNAYECYWFGHAHPYPASFCKGVVSTHSGNYCYVMWDDLPSSAVSYTYITCIDAVTGTIASKKSLPDNTGNITGYNTPGDSVLVTINGGPDIYFTPEDFRFAMPIEFARRDQSEESNSIFECDDIIEPPFILSNSNPVHGSSLEFILNCAITGSNYRISVYDLCGRNMWTVDDVFINRTQEVRTSVSSWPAGIYVIVASFEDNIFYEKVCIIN